MLGIVLDEPWHLSYPFVFDWGAKVQSVQAGSCAAGLRLGGRPGGASSAPGWHPGQAAQGPLVSTQLTGAALPAAACPAVQMYMLPEGHASGSLRLYVADDFPLRWRFHSTLLPRPMIDASLVEWQGRWYLFASDVVRGCWPCRADPCGASVDEWLRHSQGHGFCRLP